MTREPYVTTNSDAKLEKGSAVNVDYDDPKKQTSEYMDVEEQGDADQPNFFAKASQSFKNWRQRERTNEDIRNRNICLGVSFCVAFIIGLALLIASLKKVDETSFGVQYNIHKKELDDAAKSGGLFLGPPGYKFIKFPSTYVTVDLNDRTCVSRDGLRIVFSVTFQYKMTETNVLPAILKYRNYEKWAEVVTAAGHSAVHHSCGNYIISDFQNKRGEIQANMEDNVRLKLEGDPESNTTGVYAMVVSLQLQNVELPAEYNEAVQEKQSAEEDISLAQNQRKQATTQAETELLKAQEEAKRILDSANNDAEVLLTEARLKAQETTFAFEKEAQTILDVKASFNLTTDGVLAYLYNSLLSEVSDLKILTGEPAQLSRSSEL